MSSPGIVTMMKFVRPSSKLYSGYVKYIDRNEALRQSNISQWDASYDGYNKYMSNPKKSDGLFTENKDKLNLNDQKMLKEKFQVAQKNKSIMWQTVVSFDNKFLEKYGLYNSKTGSLDQQKLRDAIRKSMPKMLMNEGLGATTVWAASIHLNTDNIHIHIATVETQPYREKIKFKDSRGVEHEEYKGTFHRNTLGKFKSAVANNLVNRDQSLARISELIRDDIPSSQYQWKALPDKNLILFYKDIRRKLPEDRRLWKYNMQGMSDIRPALDAFSAFYIKNFQSDNLKELDQLLLKEVKFRQEVYGSGKSGKDAYRPYEFRNHKYDELFAGLGNSILREMKSDDWVPNKPQTKNNMLSKMSALKRALAGDVKQHLLAAREYEKIQKEKEQQHQNELYR